MAVEPSAVISNKYKRRLLRRSWRTRWIKGGEQTVNILRSTASGGSPVAGVAPTATPVAGLTGLNVVISGHGRFRAVAKPGDYVRLQEGERRFEFIDLPAGGGVAANTLTAHDVITAEGGRWRVTKEGDRALIYNDPIADISWGIYTQVVP